MSLFNATFFSLFPGSPSSMPHMPYEKSKMIDITRDKPIKIAVRVAVPVRDHPKVSSEQIVREQDCYCFRIVICSLISSESC